MTYEIEFKPRAVKDLKVLPKETRQRIMDAIEEMRSDLFGDVKKLTTFTPEYRLRVGQYRVLFEIEAGCDYLSRTAPQGRLLTEKPC